MTYPQTPLVSIIIVNWNGKEFLERCLRSVLNTNYRDLEVIFIDNASTDGSLDYVKERFGEDIRLKIVESRDNLGFSGGCNMGFRYAKGKYVVFLNNDTEVDRNWIKELVEIMESDPSVGEAQSKIRYMDTKRIQTVGNIHDYYVVYQQLIGRGEIDRGQYDGIREISFASGAAMIARRSLVEKIGLFDPKYFLYHEDIDFGWRVLLAGYRATSAPKSIVYHKGGAAIRKFSDKVPNLWAYNETKSRLSLLIKNYDFRNVLKTVPIFLLMFLGGAVVFMFKRNFRVTRAILAGILWNLVNLKYVWKKRLVAQYLVRKVPDNQVTRYFIKLKPSALLAHYLRNPLRPLI